VHLAVETVQGLRTVQRNRCNRTEADKVGIITLNRPKQLNALNDQLMNELGEASRRLMRR
jgi:enoyl-CoA hydratase/carnithine racemase